jgi:hypothetical protein
VHSAEDWEELLLPEGPEGAPRQQKLGKQVVFRADAAFAKPEIYEALEERGVWSGTRVFFIKPRAGKRGGGWWRR